MLFLARLWPLRAMLLRPCVYFSYFPCWRCARGAPAGLTCVKKKTPCEEQNDMTPDDLALFAKGFDGVCSIDTCTRDFFKALAWAPNIAGSATMSTRFPSDNISLDHDLDEIKAQAEPNLRDQLKNSLQHLLFETLVQLSKCPDNVTVKRVSHCIQTATQRFGARALFRAAQILHTSVDEDMPLPLQLVSQFIALASDFVLMDK